jgi:organic radical activating enzyme
MHGETFSLKDEPIDNLPEKCRSILKSELAGYGVSTITENRQKPLNIYLILTQSCNLNCPYCYQSASFKSNAKQMSIETIDSAIRFAVKTFHETAIAFTLFGGEPFTRFDLIKYAVEKYPMFRYRIITNGYVLNEQSEIYDWVWDHGNNCNISVSISSLKFKYGKDYLEKAQKLLKLVNHVKGDIHYVVDDPQDDTAAEVIHIMGSCSCVRISCARHHEKLIENKATFLFWDLVIISIQ